MMLRVLHPERDELLYRDAWQWKREYPKRVRQWDGLKHFRHWFKLMEQRVTVGVFDSNLIALVTLQPRGNDTYEVHVDCLRNVNRQSLLIALLNIRKVVFEEWGAREVFVGVISKNCGILRIAAACGFTRDGIEERVGSLRFIRLRMTDVEYQDNNQHRLNQQPVPAAAGSFQPRH